MPIDFPSSPTLNDIYTYNGNIWKWNGTEWVGVNNSPMPLSAANGGTGITSYSVGDILYANTTTSLDKLSPSASNLALRSGGANAALTLAAVLPPTGTVHMYAGNTAPVGWLLCDGTAVSRTTYATLFALISTTYGVGDNSTTFNVPDLRGRTTLGVGTGSGLTARALAATTGAETVAISTSEMAAHTHTASDSGHTHAAATSGTISADHTHAAFTDGTQLGRGQYGFVALGGGYAGNLIVRGSDNGKPCSSGNVSVDHTHSFTTNSGTASITISNNGSGTGHANMQPSLTVNFIIKT